MLTRNNVGLYVVAQCTVLALLVTCLLGQGTSRSTTWIKTNNPLYAVAGEAGGVYIRWRVAEWRKGLAGFELRRRHRDANGKWTGWVRVGGYPIEPDLTEKHLKDLGLTQVLGRMAEWDKVKNPRRPAEIIRKMQASADEYKQVTMLTEIREWAIAFGFARVDTDAPRGMVCEYTVSPVVKDASGGLVSRQAMGSVRVRASFGAFSCPPLHEAKAVRVVKKGRVEVSFKIRKADLEAYGGSATSLGLLRASSPGRPMGDEVLAKVFLRNVKLSADGMYAEYSLFDPKAGDGVIKYAVAPMAGNTIGQLSQRIILEPAKDPVQKPTDVVAEIRNGRIVVSWKHTWQKDSIKGFRIQRLVSGGGGNVAAESGKLTVVAPLLPHGVRSWTDDTRDLAKLSGRKVRYFVTALSGDSRPNASDSSPYLYVPPPAPAAPGGFTAEVVIENGTPTITCEWDAVKPGRISSYRVEKYVPAMGIWSRFKSSPTNACRKEVGRNGGSLTLRVKAVAVDGQESDPSQVVTVKWPPMKTLSVEQITFWKERRADGSLKLKWSAPATRLVKGFRIAENGTTIAAEKELGPYVREFIVWTPPKNGCKYELRAVDVWDRVSEAVSVEVKAANTSGPIEARPNLGNHDVRKAKNVVETKAFYGHRDKRYSRCEFLQWEDGYKVLHGTSKYYRRDDGGVRMVVEYRLGQTHGITREYDRAGALTKVSFLLHDKLVSMGEYVKVEGTDKLTEADMKWLEDNGRLN